MARPTGSASQDEGDWSFKTCKKIAQLTKVIYALNCKAEDNDERTQWLIRTHKSEIDRLAAEYEQKIASLTEKLLNAETERARSLSGVESTHRKLLKETQDGFTSKLASLALEVEQSKRAYQDAVREIKDRSATELAAELARVQELKDGETAGLVKEYNERYKSMLAEQLDARDALEQQLNSEWGARVKELEEELDASRKQGGQQLDAKARALQETLQQNAGLVKQRDGFQAELAQLERKLSAAQSQQALLERLLADQQSSLGATRTAEEELRARVAALEQAAQTQEAALEQARASFEEAQRKVDRLSSDCANAENAKALAETQRDSARSDLTTAAAELVALRAQMQALEEKAAGASSEAGEHEATVKRLMAQLEEERARATAALEEKLAAERMRLNAEVEAQKRAADEFQAKMEAERKARAADAAAAEQRLREFAESQGRSTKEQEEAHAAALAAMEAQRLVEAEALRGTGNARAEELEQQLVEARARIATEAQAAEGLQTRIGELQADVEKLEGQLSAQCADAEARAAADGSRLANLEATVAELESRGFEDLQAQQARTATELEELRRRSAEEIAKLTAEWTARLREADTKQRDEIRVLKAHHSDELKNLRDVHATALANTCKDSEMEISEYRESMSRALADAKAAAAATERQLNAQLLDMQARLDNLLKAGDAQREESSTHAKAMQDQIERLEGRLREASEATAAELGRAQQDIKAQLAALSASHETQLQDMRRTHLNELEKQRESAAAALAKAEAAAAEHRQEEAARHAKAMDAYKEALIKDKNDVVSSVNDMYLVKMRELQERCDDAIAVLNTKLKNAAERKRETDAQLDAVSAECQRNVVEVEGLKRSLEQLSRLAQEDAEAAKAELAAREAELGQKHTRATEQLQRFHSDAMAALERRRAEEAQSYETLVAELRATLKELEHKYAFRESRAEDVDLINQLIKDNRAKEQSLLKAYEDMKMYKLELINREENYNKLFGRKPLVQAAATNDLPVIADSQSLPMIKPAHRKKSFSRASFS